MLNLNIFLCVVINFFWRWNVIVHTSLPYNIVGVTTASNNFNRRWIGNNLSVNSFLNMPNFAQAFAILLWSSVSCRFPRFTTLPRYAAVSSFDTISTLIRPHFASFAPTPYPILLYWIFFLSWWIFRQTFAAAFYILAWNYKTFMIFKIFLFL